MGQIGQVCLEARASPATCNRAGSRLAGFQNIGRDKQGIVQREELQCGFSSHKEAWILPG